MISPNMKRYLLLTFFLVILSILALPSFGESKEGQAGDKSVFAPMAGPGKKVPLGNDYYLMYSFDRKPKLGTMIMKVEIFTKDGKKDTSFEVKGDAGMPSMKGAHETGEKAFALSKRGDYLLPVNLVMPGDWEVRITVLKDGKVLLRGRHNFDV